MSGDWRMEDVLQEEMEKIRQQVGGWALCCRPEVSRRGLQAACWLARGAARGGGQGPSVSGLGASAKRHSGWGHRRSCPAPAQPPTPRYPHPAAPSARPGGPHRPRHLRAVGRRRLYGGRHAGAQGAQADSSDFADRAPRRGGSRGAGTARLPACLHRWRRAGACCPPASAPRHPLPPSAALPPLPTQVLGDRLHCVFVDNGLLRYKVGAGGAEGRWGGGRCRGGPPGGQRCSSS